MAIREILRKLTNRRGQDESFSGRGESMTPDEVELMWYKRKEYLANVKQELKRYRDRERNTLWGGTPMNDEHQIIKAKNVFKNQKNVFKK